MWSSILILWTHFFPIILIFTHMCYTFDHMCYSNCKKYQLINSIIIFSTLSYNVLCSIFCCCWHLRHIPWRWEGLILLRRWKYPVVQSIGHCLGVYLTFFLTSGQSHVDPHVRTNVSPTQPRWLEILLKQLVPKTAACRASFLPYPLPPEAEAEEISVFLS